MYREAWSNIEKDQTIFCKKQPIQSNQYKQPCMTPLLSRKRRWRTHIGGSSAEGFGKVDDCGYKLRISNVYMLMSTRTERTTDSCNLEVAADK